AHHLNVEGALADRAARGLPHAGERRREQVVQGRALLEPAPELSRLAPELPVRELLDLGLERVHDPDELLEALAATPLAELADLLDDQGAILRGVGFEPRFYRRGSRTPGGDPRPAGAERPQVISRSFSRTAYTTASIRECRCSFSRMLRMWFLTVFSEMYSSLAMSRLFLPWATSLRTSISRSVSRGLGTCVRSPVDLLMAANSLSSLEAIEGEMRDCPAHTDRMASATSSIGISLSRYPEAPALIASYRSASSSEIVSIRIFTCGRRSRISPAASMPERLGIRTSIKMTSGMSSWAFSTASTPSEASPTSSRSSSWSRTICRPRRNSAWSSATMTRSLSG